MISAFRGQGYSEDQVALKAGYRGPGQMRQELEGGSFPTWFIEGDSPPQPSKPAPRKRLGRGSGPVKELPPARNSVPLFREKLEALTRGNEDLRHRKEKLQGGLFHQSAVYTDPIYFPREELPEDQWKLLCETYNLDPNEAGFLDTNAKTWILGEGTPAPQAPLPALIAAYVLMEGDVGSLLGALHPGVPSAEVIEQIRKHIEGKKTGPDKLDGLKVRAQQLARLVRGGEVSRGRDPVGLSCLEVNLACRITDERKAGVPDPEILEKLRHNLTVKLEEELTWDEFCRLRDLDLEWPFQ